MLVMLIADQPLPIISEVTGVSICQLRRYKKMYELTGNPFPPTKTPQNACLLQPWAMEKVLELLSIKPDLYLDEIQLFLFDECQIYVSLSTISRHLKSSEWKKKRQQLVAAQRNDRLRNDWLRKISLFTSEMFVFCDESGTDRRDGVRRTAWAPPGVTPIATGKFERGTRFHILPAISVDGIIDLLVYKGQSNKEGFVAWVKDCVLPKMNPFPDRNSILVMDNASWHHGDEITKACFDAGVLLWYLPPYSPDLNPIEAMFRDIKAYMRREYKKYKGDGMTEAEFKEFLYNCAMEVGGRTRALRGHYKQAFHTHRESEDEVDYTELYRNELIQFKLTGTVV